MIDGAVQKFGDPGDAITAGIGMVHQHFMLVPVFSVWENVVLGVEPVKGLGVMNRKEARTEVRDISERYGLAVDPDALVEDLPVGIQQRVEIIKVLLRGAKILVFDEPTAVLTPQEVEEFFGIVAELKGRGATIIFITHKLKEALAIADDITVLRGGKVAGHADPATATPEILASMMVGRDIDLVVDKAEAEPGETVLELSGVQMLDDYGRSLLKDVEPRRPGRRDRGRRRHPGQRPDRARGGHHGAAPHRRRQGQFRGSDISNHSPRQRHEAGIAHVPEDRNHMGMVGSFTIAENLVLDSYYAPPFSKRGVLHRDVIRESATQLVEDYDVRPPIIDNSGDALSGGNAQKMIVAREFSRDVPLVVCAQPTRGIDVGSIEYIHEQIVRKRDEGKAILIVSTELDEIFALSDRILVMFDGRIVAELKASETTPTEVGLYMAGKAA